VFGSSFHREPAIRYEAFRRQFTDRLFAPRFSLRGIPATIHGSPFCTAFFPSRSVSDAFSFLWPGIENNGNEGTAPSVRRADTQSSKSLTSGIDPGNICLVLSVDSLIRLPELLDPLSFIGEICHVPNVSSHLNRGRGRINPKHEQVPRSDLGCRRIIANFFRRLDPSFRRPFLLG
jgi:hypothetical protein